MGTFIFISLLVLAIFHFILESTILPDIRMGLRFQLNALEDKLRVLNELPNQTADNKKASKHLTEGIEFFRGKT